MKETGQPNDLLQNRNSLCYKMMQQLGKDEVAVLPEREKQDRELLLKSGSGFSHKISIWDLITSTLWPYKSPETKLHEWVLTTQGGLRAGLLRICSSGGGGSTICAPFCVYTHVPVIEISDRTSTLRDSGFRFL